MWTLWVFAGGNMDESHTPMRAPDPLQKASSVHAASGAGKYSGIAKALHTHLQNM